jgi:hypothetical protein
MKTRLLIALLALISLPILASATNYDVALEGSANQYMCLDTMTGDYFVKLDNLEYAGHSQIYIQQPNLSGPTFVQMYASVIMCTAQYENSKVVGAFTVHGYKDILVKDLNVNDSGFCAVANKPPQIDTVFATVPKMVPTPTRTKMMSFDVHATLSDVDFSGFAGLEWKLESTCFDTIEGLGFTINKTIMIPASLKNCKIKLTVEDHKEGYATTEFFVPFRKITPNQ